MSEVVGNVKENVLGGIKKMKEELTVAQGEIQKLTVERNDLKDKLTRTELEFSNVRNTLQDNLGKKELEFENYRNESIKKTVGLEKEVSDSKDRIKMLEEELTDAKRSMEEIKKALEI
ncbi:MAG: hypothetical protein HQM08_08835 [Candidatus Riflebacteria bacterium]|nr:hypothetical protein [Candidatus Riflebacteria bacterium]